MAEFKLGRIRFVWKDQWTAATVYYKDDVVRRGGKTYICQVGHTSDTDFNVDLNFSPSKWNLLSDGQNWRGDWTTNAVYSIGDIVKYGSNVYVANTGHTSAATSADGLEADQNKWDLFAEGFDWKGNWSTETRYKVNDIVRYGGYTYVANTGHTSASTVSEGLEADQSKWDSFNEGIEYKTDWETAVRYKVNDVVKYGGGLWICVTQHTATDFISDESNWESLVNGFVFRDEWSNLVTYQPGDIVRYGGNQYVAKTNHLDSTPTVNLDDWALFAEGFNFVNAWLISQNYRIGDIVRVSATTYLATQDSPSIQLTVTATADGLFEVSSTADLEAGMVVNFSGSTFGGVATNATYYIDAIDSITEFSIAVDQDGTAFVPDAGTGSMTVTASAHPTNTSYWQVLSSGIEWKGAWTDDEEYEVSDAVSFAGSSYICIKKHRSEGDDGSTISPTGGGAPNSRPDQVNGNLYWNILSAGDETNVLVESGDLVFYNEGTGPARLPIGTEGQVLTVAEGKPVWETLGNVEFQYFVNANIGVDQPAPDRGITLNRPWKTIRYAAEQVLKGPRFNIASGILELNRVFLQKEVTAWIRDQVEAATPGSIWENFVYDTAKCERDVGFIIDRIVYDLTHGGNLKTRAAAQTLLNVLDQGPFSTAEDENGTGPYNNLSIEGPQSVLAYQFLLSLIETVLNQETPDVLYQNVTDDSTAIATQFVQISRPVEPESITVVSELLNIIITALDTQDPTTIPPRYVPNNLIRVATGRYRETLPIIVPAGTCIIGDELRSTNAGPATSLINISDSFYTVNTLDHYASVIRDVVTGTSITPTTGNTETQIVQFPTGDVAEGQVVFDLAQVIKHQIDFKLGTMHTSRLTDPVNYNTSYLVGYGNARKLLQYNREFLLAEVLAYLREEYPTLRYGKTRTKRDAGYLIDALIYDLTYGGNALSVQAGLAYFDGDNADSTISRPQIPESIKQATLDSLAYLRNIAAQIAVNTAITPLQTEIGQFRDTAGSAAAATLITNNLNAVISIITAGPGAVGTVVTLTDPTPADGVNTTTALINAYNDLSTNFSTISAATVAWINSNYPDLVYNSTKCARDVEIILKAVGFDFMFNSNYQTLKAAHAYLRRTASEVYTLNQKTVTRLAIEYALTDLTAGAVANVNSDATAVSRIGDSANIIDYILFGATNEGSVCQTEERNRDYAVLMARLNIEFVINEMTAYVEQTFKGTVTDTAATTNLITIDDTSWLTRNASIVFTGDVIGGLQPGRVYYVQNIESDTEFSVATTRNAVEPLALSTASGSLTVELFYDSVLCARDTETYVEATIEDLIYPGNYHSRYVARYYVNGVTGSLEEDMFYLRDGTGLRNMTLADLTGDLEPANEFGTSRPTAGAYASLDPGFGPDDFDTWILSRSPYVQNVTTFGYAATGQKIDGALHNGGNDSMVSNDFTQVISDGIGAWVTNNARAELVSVFTYYSHVGYLAENGGRIRGTNGNNSYGDFGSVAEGVDGTETPNTAVVDNIFGFRAEVGEVTTNGSNMLRYEFLNAGIDYTTASWQLSGGGIGAIAEQDEFRDGGVYQVRLTETEELLQGGRGFIQSANTAQAGTTSAITIAATDDNPDARYVGMTLYITGGSGVGQIGIIDSYNSGTKVANIVKISDGTAGWDHIVPGTTITAPDASSTYRIEPTVSFSAPPFSSAQNNVPSTGVRTDVVFGETSAIYTGLTGTYSGAGTPVDATFEVVKTGFKYTVTPLTAGSGYERLETITISGTDVGGASPANDIVLTITAVDSVTGALVLEAPLEDEIGGTVAVQPFDVAGDGAVGLYVATRANGTTYSTDGATWTDATAIGSGSWISIAHALIDDEFRYKPGTETTADSLQAGVEYKILTSGDTDWGDVGSLSSNVGSVFTATGAGTGTGIAGEAYERRDVLTSIFVAIDTTNQVAYSENGLTWTNYTLPATVTWSSVTYGNDKFVAIASDSTTVATSRDGINWTASGTLPSTGYTEISYGKGTFLAVKPGAVIAVSADGDSWEEESMPGTRNWISVAWGNGRFVAVASDNNVGAFSLDGITWADTTLPTLNAQTPSGYQQIRYGQGVFMATAFVSGQTAYDSVATSENGLNWTTRDLGITGTFAGFGPLAHGNPGRSGKWVVLSQVSSNIAATVSTGATARGRVEVADGQVFEFRVTEPGSNYTSAPTMTITDPGITQALPHTVRIGDGVLANPSFVSRGAGYVTGNADIIGGDGFANNFQPTSVIAVRRITQRPVPGSNIVFDSLPDRIFKLVTILTFRGSADGTYTANFQISPALTLAEAPDHLTGLEARIRYSQCRLTGHDFLDIGTGNFDNTNYPGLPLTPAIPANETRERGGGRVFFTATDQDGNFRVGDLFSVEQSTGVATLNADAFNISGLQELNLGAVSLAGQSPTITEFSTDPFFTADSDNVVPTQRAIKAYIASQIGGGGAALNVNSITAGSILINSNQITTITDAPILMNANFDFRGGILGVPLAFSYFLV